MVGGGARDRGAVAAVYAPKVRGWREKFDAHALAPLARLALVDDAAFLLFLSFGVDEDEHFAVVDFVLQEKETAVRADDDGFAGFLEFAAVVGAAFGAKAHFVEDASAATRVLGDDVVHKSMVGWEWEGRQLRGRGVVRGGKQGKRN